MITMLRLLLLVFALETLTFAQVATGVITGTVIDASGASVPKASVRIVNEETGVARALVTDSAGLYVGTNLVPGKYKVEVNMPGFQNEAKIGLVLSLDQTMTVNFTIRPGDQKQVVTVVDRSEQLVEAATSSLGQVIEESQIRDLPLNGRSFQQLIGLSAGAQPGPQGRFSQGHHLNGGRGEGNAFLVDGLDISSHGNDPIRTFPSLEAIGEFKIITNSFTAEYGRTLSGVISTHIKSGTNEYHGTLFEFLRNKVLDARNFFAPTKPKYNFNQFGGSFGGPAIKDKLFFFGDYQGTRIRQESPQLRNIPTPAMRNGDFSAVPSVIYDPTSTPRVPFPNNRIPAARFDKPSALMFSLLPDPNQAGPNNFLKITGVINDVDAFDFRSDYNLNENNRLSVVGTYSKTLSDQEPPFERISGALITTRAQIDSKSISLNYTRVFGPTQVNELIVGWKRDVLGGPPTAGHQYEPEAGIRYLNTNPDDPNTTGFPLYLIPGYTMFGGPAGGPATQAHNIPQIADNFSFNRGRHTFKTGAALRFRQFNLGQNIWSRGLLVFLGLMTSNGGVGGDPAASALLGYPLTATRDFSLPWGERIKEYGFYFQDDFKASRRLTLNLGVRYDLYMPATEDYDRLANFDIASTTMILANQNGVSASTLETNKRNFSPHIGFAYLLTDDGRTVLRGGYGIGYLALQTGAVGTGTERLTTNQPFKVNYATTFDFLNPRVRVSDGLLLPVPDPKNPSGDVNLHLSRDPTPYMQQWNFNIQRALPLDFLGEIAYAGSSGVHLTGNVNINQAPPGPTAPGPRSLITPRVNQILGLFNRESSIYHSVQFKLQRRFASGFYLLAAYTHSKAIDNGSFTSQGSDASSTGPQDARNWEAERGRSDFDFTHRFVTSYIYELPVGKGHRVLGQAPAVVDYLLGGWQINGITTLQSGNVFTPIVANPRTNAGPGGQIRPDRVGSGELPESEQSINKWFDKTAFVPQGTGGTDPYHFGNSGRNILRGPKLVNFDFSLFKEMPITERVRLEFRSEFFNIFNTPAFNLPDRSVDTPLGGVISSARAPRQIQLALKLKF